MGNKGERDGSSVSHWQVRGCSVLMRLIGRSTTCQRLGSDESDTPYSLDQNDNNISRRYLETVELRNLLHMVKTTLPPNNRGITQSSSFASLAPTNSGWGRQSDAFGSWWPQNSTTTTSRR